MSPPLRQKSSSPPRKSRALSPRAVAWLALREVHNPDFSGDAQELLGALAVEAKLDARDRGLAFELMQGILRNRLLLDAAIQCLEGFEISIVEPPLQDILRIGAYQHFHLTRIPSHALVFATVEIARVHLDERAAAFANAALHRMLSQYPNPADDLAKLSSELPLETRHSFPGWIVRLARRTVGAENIEQALANLNKPLPLYGRINRSISKTDAALSSLKSAGIEAVPRPDLAPWCIELSSPVAPVLESEIFQQGGIILQDASSQLVAEFVGAEPGMTVVDFCSAPGGKTTALAAAMQSQGTLIACDVSKSRMERLTENIERLGFGPFIQTILMDPSAQGLASLRGILPNGAADRILVDAPCSGLGTLRRHPEIRWRLKNADLKRLSALQGEILDRAATIVKPDGLLVYGTCSLAAEENEQVIEAFLKRHTGEFEIMKPKEDLPAHFSSRINPSGWLRLLPHRENTDSASAVQLKRLS